jgi:hypothetical protein
MLETISRQMNGWWGRGARISAGLLLIVVGLAVGGSTPLGLVLAIVGLVPLGMGAWGHCLVEALVPRRAA